MIFRKNGEITENTVFNINKLENGDYEIVKYKKKRTISQNKLYWKIITIRGKELGYYPEELHEVVKNSFGKVTTTNTDTIEFGNFIEYVYHQASMDGVIIQEAEEYKNNF